MREHAFWWKILFFSFSFAQKSLKSSRAFKKITRFLTFSILALFLGSKMWFDRRASSQLLRFRSSIHIFLELYVNLQVIGHKKFISDVKLNIGAF